MTSSPIFVVGSDGSGSTLLRLMLDSHERIAIPAETGFLRLVLAHQWVPYWELGDQWYRHLGLDEDALMTRLAGFYGGLFQEYAERQGKQRWGEKTPFHVWLLPLALRLFPDAIVVGVVRHPGAVAVSLRDRFDRDLSAAARYWRRSNLTLARELSRLGDRALLLRYEDLVRDPATVMRAVLSGIGEPWSDAVLAHHDVQATRPAPAEVEGFTRADRPLDTKPLDRWESALHGARRETVLAPTAPLAAFFGYSLQRTLPLERWSADSPVLTGEQLRERQRSHRGVKWDRPPQPAPENRPLLPPPPRPGTGGSVADVRVSDLVRDRARRAARRVLPGAARRRVNRARRRLRGRR